MVIALLSMLGKGPYFLPMHVQFKIEGTNSNKNCIPFIIPVLYQLQSALLIAFENTAAFSTSLLLISQIVPYSTFQQQ